MVTDGTLRLGVVCAVLVAPPAVVAALAGWGSIFQADASPLESNPGWGVEGECLTFARSVSEQATEKGFRSWLLIAAWARPKDGSHAFSVVEAGQGCWGVDNRTRRPIRLFGTGPEQWFAEFGEHSGWVAMGPRLSAVFEIPAGSDQRTCGYDITKKGRSAP